MIELVILFFLILLYLCVNTCMKDGSMPDIPDIPDIVTVDAEEMQPEDTVEGTLKITMDQMIDA